MRCVCVADIHGSSVALLKASGMARQAKADVILIAGDITAHSVLNRFCDLLPYAAHHANAPIFCTLGNHDSLRPAKYFPDNDLFFNINRHIFCNHISHHVRIRKEITVGDGPLFESFARVHNVPDRYVRRYPSFGRPSEIECRIVGGDAGGLRAARIG